MKNAIRLCLTVTFLLTLFTFQFLSSDAQAFPSFYDSNCASCHAGASEPTCIGCHKHGAGNFSGATDKPNYLPGETVSVNLTGDNKGGWVRAMLYDQNGAQVAITQGSAGGMSNAVILPATLSAPAPTTPGTYTWQAAWFGNNNGAGHGERERVNINSFTVLVPAPVDTDGDGTPDTEDCAPNDPAIHPGATEIPYNGIDENCNGMADDVVDADGDGFNSMDDCNDNDAAINPGATEILYNGIDENCNGMADDTVDADGDGFNSTVDCDDTNAAINPGATEILYNGIDENCNGMSDDTVDADGDGFNSDVDCDDGDPAINPGATDIACDGIDQDCSGSDTLDATCLDSDNDGFSDAIDCAPQDATINPSAEEICGDGIDQDCSGGDLACPADPNDIDDDADGYTENQGDCDDNDAALNPGAEDICGDGIDQDCDGADLACPVDPNDVDDDADGYTENQGDCDDTDAALNPGAEDICGDGIDQDCSGADAVCTPTEPTCTDNDGDNYATEGGECGPVDCNDDNPAINPASAERCEDGIDNNCDGLTDGQDEQACPAPPSCTDADADNFFAEADCNTVQDCNDNDNLTFPGATELCGDAIDNDCDGSVDEGCDIVNDGVVLYENLCASCHGELSDSKICGKDAENIMDAIIDNKGGMSAHSPLTDTQLKLIADALSSCKESDDDEEDDDEYDDHEESKTEKVYRSKGKRIGHIKD
ncbi:MAG: hypothetical protein C0619_04260 [Desulfuromonas sp.]|nr:MAG: hypothetical protein C0619_04260 [Desulfuromonas sp.]